MVFASRDKNIYLHEHKVVRGCRWLTTAHLLVAGCHLVAQVFVHYSRDQFLGGA